MQRNVSNSPNGPHIIPGIASARPRETPSSAPEQVDVVEPPRKPHGAGQVSNSHSWLAPVYQWSSCFRSLAIHNESPVPALSSEAVAVADAEATATKIRAATADICPKVQDSCERALAQRLEAITPERLDDVLFILRHVTEKYAGFGYFDDTLGDIDDIEAAKAESCASLVKLLAVIDVEDAKHQMSKLDALPSDRISNVADALIQLAQRTNDNGRYLGVATEAYGRVPQKEWPELTRQALRLCEAIDEDTFDRVCIFLPSLSRLGGNAERSQAVDLALMLGPDRMSDAVIGALQYVQPELRSTVARACRRLWDRDASSDHKHGTIEVLKTLPESSLGHFVETIGNMDTIAKTKGSMRGDLIHTLARVPEEEWERLVQSARDVCQNLREPTPERLGGAIVIETQRFAGGPCYRLAF